MGGKTSQQTQPQAKPGLSKEEKLLVQKEIKLADFQLKELKRQAAVQDLLFADLPTRLAEDKKFQADERAFQAEQRKLQKVRDELAESNLLAAKELLPLQTAIAQQELERLESGGEVSPETAARIDELTAQQQEIGLSDLGARTDKLIEQITEEVAPGKGLRPTDTPIVQRLDQVGEESAQQKGQFIRQLQSGAAEAKLNFPLAQGQLTSARGEFLANLGGLAGRFQSELQQQSISNRLQATQQTGNLGLGLATGITTQPGQLGASLQSGRITQGGTRTTTTRGITGNEIASIAGGAGSAIQGIAALIRR